MIKKRWNIILRDIIYWALIFIFCSRPGWKMIPFTSDGHSLLIPLIYGFVFNAFVLYFSVWFLLPRKKSKLKSYRFWLASFILILVASIIEASIDWIYCTNVGIQNPAYLMESQIVFYTGMIIQNSYAHIFFWLLAFAYRYPFEKEKLQQEMVKLKEEKLSAELNYLKAKINPHFLFNGINNIYHLIDNDSAKAKLTLHKFSNLLRYQLYECNDDFIEVSKELEYLENFISLEQIRKGEDAKINWNISNDDNALKIAPLLITPFIENAFKYLSSHEDPNQNILDIELNITDKSLILKVLNSYHTEVMSSEAGGFGLENVQKRLNLIYPNNHELKIIDNKELYNVSLQINLEN